MRKRSFALLAAFACAAGFCANPAAAGDWLQFGGDPAHSGYSAQERGYATAGGNRLAFAAVTLPDRVDVAPIFLEAVATASGIHDLLFVVARNGNVIALDAGNGAVIWSHRPGGAGTLTTSSAAAAPDRRHVFAYGLDGKVHEYQVGDGTEVLTGGWPQTVTLKPDVDKVAAGLTVATDAAGHAYLLAVTNSYFDKGDFQGALTSIDLATGEQHVFNAQCSDLAMHFVKNGISSGFGQNDCPSIAGSVAGQTANSGIWGRAGAVYDAATGRVYIATGNGLFDPNNDLGHGRDWGDSVLALNPDGTGAGGGLPLDSYTPVTDAQLLQNDADLGSTSPAILPAPIGSAVAHLAVQGGKDQCVRLLDLDHPGGVSGPGHVGGELQATGLPGFGGHCLDGANANNFLTQPAVWVNPADRSTWVFIAHGGGLAAFRLVLDGDGEPSLSPQWSMPGAGTSPVVANGTVYYASTNALRALDATTGAPIWSDERIGSVHWQSPIVVNGRIYMVDQTSKLWVYVLDGVFRASFD